MLASLDGLHIYDIQSACGIAATIAQVAGALSSSLSFVCSGLPAGRWRTSCRLVQRQRGTMRRALVLLVGIWNRRAYAGQL